MIDTHRARLVLVNFEGSSNETAIHGSFQGLVTLCPRLVDGQQLSVGLVGTCVEKFGPAFARWRWVVQVARGLPLCRSRFFPAHEIYCRAQRRSAEPWHGLHNARTMEEQLRETLHIINALEAEVVVRPRFHGRVVLTWVKYVQTVLVHHFDLSFGRGVPVVAQSLSRCVAGAQDDVVWESLHGLRELPRLRLVRVVRRRCPESGV